VSDTTEADTCFIADHKKIKQKKLKNTFYADSKNY
jgi:hypothetical protein